MTNKKREGNFELLRIICMIMIVILHFNKYGLVLANVTPGTIEFYIFNFLEYFCVVAVNVYILITGYFMINKERKLSKIIDLELQLLFYTIFIYLALIFTNQINFSIKDSIRVVAPFLTCAYWFMSSYILLYLLIPFINKLTANMDKKEYRNILLILTPLLTIIASFLPIRSVININNGYSVIWFIYLYLLGGYIKMYSLPVLDKLKQYHKVLLYILITAIMLTIYVLYNKIIDSKSIMMFLDYNYPLTSLNSLIIFYFFKNIRINNKLNNLILNISSKTLAVYLIHLHPIFKTILWENIFQPKEYLGSYKIYLCLVVDIVLLFLVSYLVESIRLAIHNKLKLSKKLTSLLKFD